MSAQRASKRAARRVTKAQRAAFHEAGHAVAAYSLRLPFRQASIRPKPESGAVGHVPFELGETPVQDGPGAYGERRAEKRLEHRMVVLLAGMAAEAVLTGRRAWRGEEFEAAGRLAAQRCSSGDEVDAYLKWLLLRVENELRLAVWWKMVEALASRIEEHGQVSYSQAWWVVEGTLPGAAGRTA